MRRAPQAGPRKVTEAESIAADLKADGQLMILSRSTAGEFDPVAGAVSGDIVQQWEVYGITANYNSQTRLASQNQPGTAILTGDKKAIIGAVDKTGQPVEPMTGDTLKTKKGVVWRVMAIDTVDPQGDDLLYVMQVRR